MKRSGHFSVAVKQESLFSIKWDLTTFNLLMNQFHSSKNISYSGSLISLGRKIPDVSYIVAKLTKIEEARRSDNPVLRKK